MRSLRLFCRGRQRLHLDINWTAVDAAARDLAGLKTGLCDVGNRGIDQSHDG